MNGLFKTIKGERLNLIKLNLKYLDDFHEYSLNPKLYLHLGLLKPPTNKKYSKKFLEDLISRSDKINGYWWFVYLKKEKKVIGSIGAHNLDFKRRSTEISYAISPNFWKNGFFSESIQLLIKRFVIENNFQRIFAITDKDNIASIKSLKKNCFREEGTLRNFTISSHNKFKDATLLSFCSQYDLGRFKKKKISF